MAVDRGSLTVRNITNELVDVAEWEPVGLFLGLSAAKLAEIKSSRMHNASLCKISMADAWLRSDIYATWEKLAKALDDSGNQAQAERIREKYDDGPSGGAVGYTRHGPPPGATNGAQSKRRRVASDLSSVRGQPVQPPPPVRTTSDVKKLFKASDPEGTGEYSRMEELVHVLINNELDINNIDGGVSLLNDAIKKGDLVSMKTLIALGANVNQLNEYNMTSLDVVKFTQQSDPHMMQLLKDVGGVAGQDGLPQQETVGAQQMDTGEESMSEPAGNLVLCLDNSSTMALVQLELLNQLERVTGKKITQLFQWIVASGLSGLLMLVMVYGQKSIADLRRFYFRLYDRVFANPQATDKGKELETIINEELGDTATTGDCVYMHEVKEPRLLIGAVNKRMSTLDLKFFTNYAEGANMHVWKVARYTCSSPLYFGEYDNYIDTSMLCKNLCGVALEQINSFYARFQDNTLDPVSVMVSLGDGILPPQQLSVTGPLSTYFLGSNPKLGNGKELLSVFQNFVTLYNSAASCQSESISTFLCRRRCESRGIHFFRFNPLLSESIPIPEEATIETLINIIIQTISHVVATGDGKDNMKDLLKELKLCHF